MVSKANLTSDNDSSSSDENGEDTIFDEDTCPINEINKLFTIKHHILTEEKISEGKNAYVLSLCGNRSFDTIAAGLSDGSVRIFDVASGGVTLSEKLNYHESTSRATNCICGIKYFDETTNQLLIGGTEGTISLYDLRTNHLECTFQDDSDDEKKSILSFDVNANRRVICAGTEQINKDAFILFFDIRHKKLLGGYFESHTDDVTSIVCHPDQPDALCTGSTDGLINIFDISQATEDDALLKTINSEHSVHRLNWHKNVYEKDLISCITHTNDLLVCDVNEGEILSQFNRSHITNAIKRKSIDDCNTINCHSLENGTILLLASSNFNNGEVLRSLHVQNKVLIPHSEFEENKQIVRESIFNPEKNLMVTGGEGGIITLWSSKDSNQPTSSSSSKLKIKSKFNEKLHGKKPY